MQQPGISRPATVFYTLCKVGDPERSKPRYPWPAGIFRAYKDTITIGDNVSTARVRGRALDAGER